MSPALISATKRAQAGDTAQCTGAGGVTNFFARSAMADICTDSMRYPVILGRAGAGYVQRAQRGRVREGGARQAAQAVAGQQQVLQRAQPAQRRRRQHGDAVPRQVPAHAHQRAITFTGTGRPRRLTIRIAIVSTHPFCTRTGYEVIVNVIPNIRRCGRGSFSTLKYLSTSGRVLDGRAPGQAAPRGPRAVRESGPYGYTLRVRHIVTYIA